MKKIAALIAVNEGRASVAVGVTDDLSAQVILKPNWRFNALSLQMKRNLPPKLDMLRAMTGTQFDMGYMMRQIHAHEMTLLTLDTSLIPETDDAAMKTYLSGTVRPAVAMHLQEAKQLHDQLMMQMHGGGNR